MTDKASKPRPLAENIPQREQRFGTLAYLYAQTHRYRRPSRYFLSPLRPHLCVDWKLIMRLTLQEDNTSTFGAGSDEKDMRKGRMRSNVTLTNPQPPSAY